MSAVIAENAGLSVVWTRRSRLGWSWPPGTELPLGESSEKYRVIVQASTASLTFEAFEPQIIIPGEALTDMTGTVTINVMQVGDYAESRPAILSIAI